MFITKYPQYVFAQNSVFIAENCNAFFWTSSSPSPYPVSLEFIELLPSKRFGHNQIRIVGAMDFVAICRTVPPLLHYKAKTISALASVNLSNCTMVMSA